MNDVVTIEFGRKFMDLTEEEVRGAVSVIIMPKKITNFRKLKDCFRMKVYTDWETTDDDGNEVLHTICDEIELRDPWENGRKAIDWEYLDSHDIYLLKQFCFAKGICEYAVGNPFLEGGGIRENG